VHLYLGPVNDFYKKQVRDNLDLIAQAASGALGVPVTVVLAGEDATKGPGPGSPARAGAAPPRREKPATTTLDRARSQPVVQSFLDVFPGPVEAEDIKE